jgi:hypothetical protein
METAARAHQAEIVESERSAFARKAFDVSRRCIDRAEKILEEHPIAAVRLLAVGVEVASAVAGTARDYAVPSATVTFVQQYVDENGRPKDAPAKAVKDMSLEELMEAAESLHKAPVELPCGNWSPNHADASPVQSGSTDPDPPDPDVEVPLQTGIPSRGGASIPTTARAGKSPMVKVYGL